MGDEAKSGGVEFELRNWIRAGKSVCDAAADAEPRSSNHAASAMM